MNGQAGRHSDPTAVLREAMTGVLTTFAAELGDDGPNADQLWLMLHLLDKPAPKEQLAAELSFWVADPAALLERAARAGRVESTSDAQVALSASGRATIGKLSEIVQTANARWRGRMNRQPRESGAVDAFLAMLQGVAVSASKRAAEEQTARPH